MEQEHQCPDEASTSCSRCAELEAKIRKLQKVTKVLTDRVERSADMKEDAYMLFQTATVLENKVQRRTSALNEALHELEASNAELQQAKRAAEEAREEIHKALLREKELSELKTRFVTIASHEFRTPLTTIQSSAELIERFEEKWDSSKKQKHLRRIQGNVQHMTSLLEDVLLVGKIDSGRVTLNLEEFQLVPFIEDVFEEISLGAGDSHQLSLCMKVSNLCIRADKGMLRVVISNLLSNAIKYSEPGTGVVLQVEGGPETFEIQVRDEGIGIPDEDLEHLFEPFHRAGNVDNRQGTGLGLAILHRAVRMHGGDITVETVLGNGTTFHVILPVRAQVQLEEA